MASRPLVFDAGLSGTMFDLGFRAAIVNYTARYRARDDYSSLNRMLSSAAVYFGSLGLGICLFVVFFSTRFPALFKVPAEYAADSVFFARVVGVSVAIGLFSALCSGILEAFQRFDLLNRAYVSVMMIRMAGSILLLVPGLRISPTRSSLSRHSARGAALEHQKRLTTRASVAAANRRGTRSNSPEHVWIQFVVIPAE